MPIRILKVPLTSEDYQSIELPASERVRPRVLSVGCEENGSLCMWVMVLGDGTQAPRMKCPIYIYSTGQVISQEMSCEHYLGTVKFGIYEHHIFSPLLARVGP